MGVLRHGARHEAALVALRQGRQDGVGQQAQGVRGHGGDAAGIGAGAGCGSGGAHGRQLRRGGRAQRQAALQEAAATPPPPRGPLPPVPGWPRGEVRGGRRDNSNCSSSGRRGNGGVAGAANRCGRHGRGKCDDKEVEVTMQHVRVPALHRKHEEQWRRMGGKLAD